MQFQLWRLCSVERDDTKTMNGEKVRNLKDDDIFYLKVLSWHFP
jgi:hypothetical protein